jgi:hypothetical protein
MEKPLLTRQGMKHTVVLLISVVMMASCARKVEVRAPDFVRTERYAYMKDERGRVYIVADNPRDFDEAMKAIHPGPASVDKLGLWVVTPARQINKKAH